MSDKLIVFVTGATGGQGGAVAHALLNGGHQVHALVRDENTPAAQALSKAGAKLSIGSFDDVGVLAAAAKGCTSLFLNLTPTRPDPTLELTHLNNLIAASLHSTPPIAHCVVSTATRAEEYTTFKTYNPNNAFLKSYWGNKKAIQDAVMARFQRWTVLQPAWLMSNFISPHADFYWGGELAASRSMTSAFGQGTKLELCPGELVGAFALAAFEGHGGGKMDGRIIKLASESLDMDGIASVMSEVSGVDVEARYRDEEEVERMVGEGHPLVVTQVWQRVDGTGVDLEEVRGWGVEIGGMGFKEYLEVEKGRLMMALGVEE